jgi:general secretion pathway protein G
MKQKRAEEGFTLIELLIVIIILAILAAIVVFAVGTTTTNAKRSSCDQDAKSVETAVEAYKAQNGGTEPADMTALVPLWLRQAPRATVATSGYAITLVGGTGEVDVNGTNYDGSTDPCAAIS